MMEAKMIIDLLVQIAVAGAVLVLVIVFVVAQAPGDNPRERIFRRATSRHWWNRTRHGP
ncbi:hypothetical protein [Paraburkholderia nemoris]|nr:MULTISPECIES: hypothetical protein [Paraburkholderia]MBK3745607.1 hypothetical protein [Paraburkholderia aspalathi]MBK3816573.1 hypothetical protein [Paraburkholderia aspalathi]MBK5153681.1 hypothetical protein [Burkholderia sp. R-69608]